MPTLRLEQSSVLAAHFAPHQINWIEAETPFHEQGRQVCALAEKSIRIGWTFCDGFKNVRKRLRFKNRDYLFVTKDLPSALEYMQQVYRFGEIFDLTRCIISHGEEFVKIPRADARGRASGFTEEIKVGVIKFDTGSRIIAFSSNPQAMAVYGGDVGLDEFAKHPNARLLWETAQGRVALANDIAVWSSHDGEDTLFYQFAQQARAACGEGKGQVSGVRGQDPECEVRGSKFDVQGSPSNCPPLTDSLTHVLTHSPSALPSPISHLPSSPWNLYYRVTMPDAIELGFLDFINRARGTKLRPEQFLADCRGRSGLPEIYEQSYLCNPVPPAASIVDWSAIERCRHDYAIERLHFDHAQIQTEFGSPAPHTQVAREQKISEYLHARFPRLFTINSQLRLGFDIAASGSGDLACIYIDAVRASTNGQSGTDLVALFTCRTDDWHFLKSALFVFLGDLPNIRGAGDESGLGQQICWEAATQFGDHKFTPVNFRAKKSDLGFALMNQLSSGEKRFPKDPPDISADFFALRKHFTGTKWTFTEGKNPYNSASHCDIAWAGALASYAYAQKRSNAWAMVG